MDNNKYVISVVGTTAIGKTALGIQLATYFNAEIISADSRQFFKEMEIGTAVPSQEELTAAKHHFIQNLSIFDNYSVGDFEKEALTKIAELHEKNDIVILLGGSGLYVDAVLKGLDYFPKVTPKIRIDLKKQLAEQGIKHLQNQLLKLDEVSYKNIEISNPQRLIRALEICIGTGKPYASFLNKNKKEARNFSTIKIGLKADREIIYNRINQRVDNMIENGLVKEAKSVYKHKDLNALQTVGYRELFLFFDGEITLKFAIEEIKKNTRRFAKRQITWFKRDTDIQWFNYNDSSLEIIKFITQSRN
ncbi:MAG: tRNA (adenosine(37)-N6)-dimethylallyltransferase MiaA [Flavobacteriaceae bacterium]